VLLILRCAKIWEQTLIQQTNIYQVSLMQETYVYEKMTKKEDTYVQWFCEKSPLYNRHTCMKRDLSKNIRYAQRFTKSALSNRRINTKRDLSRRPYMCKDSRKKPFIETCIYRKRPIKEDQSCANINKKSLIRQTYNTKRDLPKRTIYAQRCTQTVLYKRCTRIRKETYHRGPPCNTLQHLATPCNTPCNTLATKVDALVHYLRRVHIIIIGNNPLRQYPASRYNTLQHAATHCNTPQYPATLPDTPCNTPATPLQHRWLRWCIIYDEYISCVIIARRNTTTSATWFAKVTCRCVAACCSMLQHVAACCSVLQHVAEGGRVLRTARREKGRIALAIENQHEYPEICIYIYVKVYRCIHMGMFVFMYVYIFIYVHVV